MEIISEALESGQMIIKKDCSLEYTLDFAVKSDEGAATEKVELEKLVFATRLRYRNVKKYLLGIDPEDSLGIVNAHICGLTNQDMAMIESLDLSDLSLARSVATLFL